MSLLGAVYRQQRGPTLKIIFSFHCDKQVTDESVSEDFQINAAKVRFKFVHDGQLKCSWSAMRLNSPNHSSVNINADCIELNYFEKWQIYKNNWTYWKHMGKVDYITDSNNVSIFTIEINIKVSEVKTPNAHTKLYEDNMDFIDFHLSAADGSVGMHKAFLATHSIVFKKMLQGKWKDMTEGCVELEGLTRQTLQYLKDYLYLGTLPDKGLRPLLLLAKYYFIDDLKKMCIEKLVEKTTSSNLFGLLEFACDNNLPELTFYILQVIPDEVVQDAYKIKHTK